MGALSELRDNIPSEWVQAAYTGGKAILGSGILPHQPASLHAATLAVEPMLMFHLLRALGIWVLNRNKCYVGS